jgi:CRP-like cAMP-binding protein
VMAQNSALTLAFLARGAEDLLHADRMNMEQALYSVRQRLAHLLLSLKDTHGTGDTEGGISLVLPMTWHEAAELVGARPETVSRAVQALEQDGIIRVAGHRVTIPDLDPLMDELESEIPAN